MKTTDIKDYFFIIIGTTILALAINVYFDANQLVTGGITGLSIIISDVSKQLWGYEIPLAISNLVLNVPLFIIGHKLQGKAFLAKTIFATIYLSIALAYTNFVPIYTGDLMLASIYGGVISGVGLGLVFNAYATTGGTDLAGSIIHQYIRHHSIAEIMMVLDAIIIVLGLFAFGIERTMFAVISVFISAKVVDAILEGMSFAKAAFVISDNSDEIYLHVKNRLDRGATALKGKGMYTKKDKNVLLCVVPKKEMVILKEIVMASDPHAFVIVADVREVMGEGFRSIN